MEKQIILQYLIFCLSSKTKANQNTAEIAHLLKIWQLSIGESYTEIWLNLLVCPSVQSHALTSVRTLTIL